MSARPPIAEFCAQSGPRDSGEPQRRSKGITIATADFERLGQEREAWRALALAQANLLEANRRGWDWVRAESSQAVEAAIKQLKTLGINVAAAARDARRIG